MGSVMRPYEWGEILSLLILFNWFSLHLTIKSVGGYKNNVALIFCVTLVWPELYENNK